jgi:hypothetical protein
MQKQIKEVQDYFKQKILSREFEITDIGLFTVDILVDGKYKFVLWIGNSDNAQFLKLYVNASSFIQFLFAENEKEQLYNLLKDEVNKYKKEVLIKQKEEELKQLRDE